MLASNSPSFSMLRDADLLYVLSVHLQHESAAMFCYFMLGCGFLAGWNAFLTATDFFNAVWSKLCQWAKCVAIPADCHSRYFEVHSAFMSTTQARV